jgi:mannose-6-phosphate isomerase-like protein (cupin superfamily)
MKDETLYLLHGETALEIDEGSLLTECRRMLPDESYRIRAGQKHRLTAITDAQVLEVSTPELDDVVRWEDDYGRTSAQSDHKEYLASQIQRVLAR